MKAKRQRDQDGEFTSLPNGKIKMRVGLGRDVNGEYRYFKKNFAGNMTQARELAREAKRRFQSGLAPTLEQETFGSFWKEFMKARALKLKRNTIANYEQWAKVHILPKLEKKLLTAISARDIQAISNGMIQAGLRVGTAQAVYGLLAQVFKLAVTRHRVACSPMAGVERPTLPPDAEDMNVSVRDRAFTAAQVDAFLDAAQDTDWHAIFHLLFHTGLRVGEATGLCWDDVDFAVVALHVRRTLVWEHSESWYVTTPKTKHSKRHVRLVPEVLTVLHAHRKEQLQKRLRAGKDWQTHTDERGRKLDFVFTHPDGEPISDSQVRYYFMQFAQAAGITRHVTTHDTRHTAATRMVDAGVSLPVVQRILGHTNIATTNKYVRPDDEMLSEAMTALASQFGRKTA